MDNIEESSPFYTATQIRIMLAAEASFAENGIDGASMREIAVAAKQRNPFAAQYHFGSREELIRSIFDYRMRQLEEPRGRMLLRAELEGRLHDPHAIMEMIYLPQVALVEAPENHGYATFLCQYLLRRHSNIYGDFGIALPPNLSRILGLLRLCVPNLSDAAAQRRLVSSSLVFLHFLSVYGGERNSEINDETFETRLWDTLAQIKSATFMPISQGFPEGKLEDVLDWIRR